LTLTFPWTLAGVPGAAEPLAPAEPPAPALPFAPPAPAFALALVAVAGAPLEGHGIGLATGSELDEKHGCAGSPGTGSAAAAAGPARNAAAPTLRQIASRCARVIIISISLSCRGRRRIGVAAAHWWGRAAVSIG
jgi:hypothetical protein